MKLPKFKKPKFLKNVTMKMVVIWVVAFVGLLVVGFGTPAVIFAASPVSFSNSLDYNNVFYIEYRNENQTKQLFNKNVDNHNIPMKTIIDMINSGGKTNKLANFFRGNPKQTIDNNSSNVIYTSTFNSTYSQNSITIVFKQPQYSLKNITRTSYQLVDWKVTDSNAIYEIMIPLNKTGNSFQSQSWYLVTSDPIKNSSGASLMVQNKISTYGNYHKLWDYVDALNVLL